MLEESFLMAEITVIIQKNIQTMEETKLKMEMMDKEVKEFSKDLYFCGFDLEYAQLGSQEQYALIQTALSTYQRVRIT